MQSLYLLQLTGWLTLSEKVRDSKGRILGNLYILHDDIVPYYERTLFNEAYLQFLDDCCDHKDKIIKRVAISIKKDMKADLGFNLQKETTFMENIKNRLSTKTKIITLNKSDVYLDEDEIEKIIVNNIPTSKMEISKNKLTSKMETSKNNLASKMEISKNELTSKMETSKNKPTSKMETSDKIRVEDTFNKEQIYSTSTYTNINTSTVLDWKNLTLSDFEKKDIISFMIKTKLDINLSQLIIDEISLKINQDTSNPIKNIKGYMYGLIKKAKNNEFKPFLIEKNKKNTNTFDSNKNNKQIKSNRIVMSKEQRMNALNKIKKIKS